MIKHLPASEYRADKTLKYEDVLGLHELYAKLAFNSNLILSGPKGIGKSLSVATFAAEFNTPIITFDCSEDVRRSHLLGLYVLRGDETPFILGPLTTAFEIANEAKMCILCLEEINALTPQMQKVLNAPSDFRRKVEVPEAEKVFRLKNGAKLWIVGTMNTATYGGVYQLNEDLKSRFRLVPLNYPDPKKEKTVLETVLNGISDKSLIEKVITLGHETRQKALEYALSTRDLVQILEDIELVGLEKAMWIALGKFEGEDLDTVAKRIQSIFGVVVKV
jgi:nitric oxide reductase NorQ protein